MGINILKNMLIEIEVLQIRLDELERDHRRLWDQCFPRTKLTASYSGMPGSPSQPLPLTYTVTEMKKIEIQIIDVQARIQAKKEAWHKIKRKMAELEGIEHQVVYKRDIEGKSLQEIAGELNYSYDWIKKISSRTNKAPERHQELVNM